jgi:hypothetical protein
MFINAVKRAVRHWCKILKMGEHRLVKTAILCSCFWIVRGNLIGVRVYAIYCVKMILVTFGIIKQSIMKTFL